MAKILIIDDDPLVRTTLRSALLNDSHTVLVARNGVEGLRLSSETQVDLIITDIVMPEKDGFETMMELRRRRQGTDPQPGVIAMSGGAYMQTACYLQTARLMGAGTVLAKPFSVDELQRAVVAALARPTKSKADAHGAGQARGLIPVG